MARPVAILVEQNYQELEVWYPLYRLREAGHAVTLVAPEAHKTYPSKLGYPARSDAAAHDVKAADFAALVIPGGFAPDYLRRSEAVLNFVREFAALNRPLAAICHGPWVLCSTAALRGKRATGFLSVRDDMVNAGALFEDAEVVVDGHLITSRKPDDLPAFCRELLKQLGA